MSTWRIFSDHQNNFRWENADKHLKKEENCDQDTPRLPSMADLLLIRSSKLLENGGSNAEKPLFRTGLGKSVELNHSAIAKARSILGEVDGHLDGRENGHVSSPKPANILKSGLHTASEDVVNSPNSMFQTGSGKKVNISSAGLRKAKTLLGLDENCDPKQTEKQSTTAKLPAPEKPSHSVTQDQRSSSLSNSTKVSTSSSVKFSFHGSDSMNFMDDVNNDPKPPALIFQTAGGKSISVSSDALERARSLLGNPELDSFLDEASTTGPLFSAIDDKTPRSVKQKTDFSTPSFSKGSENDHSSLKNFTSPHNLSLYNKQSFSRTKRLQPGNNLITQFDAEAADKNSNGLCNGLNGHRKPTKNNSNSEKIDCLRSTVQPEIDPLKRHTKGALADISNMMDADQADNKQQLGEKRRFRSVSYVSPFKKPRSSFVTPLNKKYSSALSRLEPKETSCKQKVSSRYPIQVSRKYLKDYVLQSPALQEKVEQLPEHVKRMNPIAAEYYKFQEERLSNCSGPEAFYGMLSQSGASTLYLTKQWVLNHYKWVVWKLASYERCYPGKFSGKLLTVPNVLDELRYRYEREVNHGHRSCIKKILDGDAPPSSMMVLCISSVDNNQDLKCGNQYFPSEEGGYGNASTIELSDGWYSLKAQLDEMLSQKVALGKLFLGQKLRICGAKLCGWIGPISPFEASRTTSLCLHINGTYRCHWAERLGLCKDAWFPLAFRCIKGNGGVVPSTLVGVTRIYPVLYKERFGDGRFIVRSERMESKARQSHNQRRDVVAEGIMSSFQKETNFDVGTCDHESEEGAKLMKLLETSAEPEVLMAGMSSKQLAFFASYKAKLEATRQTEIQKCIEKAVEAAGLGERNVSPFLRVKVVGLTNRRHKKDCTPQKGLITIWNPTKKQMLELCEGQAYCVGGLVPSSSDSAILYLQARGSTSNWSPLSPSAKENFESFFSPRLSTTLRSLGDVPLSSEFDIAAFVVYVGDVYAHGHQKKQWVFVTDRSTAESPDAALLAINFFLPCVEFDSSEPVNSNLAGSVVGFFNLTKRARDTVNGVWIAEATENSDYCLSYDQAGRNHLKDEAASVLKWANASSLITEKLKERVASIISNSKQGS